VNISKYDYDVGLTVLKIGRRRLDGSGHNDIDYNSLVDAI